ncbi:MAG: ATP-grasp domain-containing protein [Candidatus Aadella gelida]|nr:ATP-grasp domain-containing protein [Candidatus Aadella gelida]
MKKLKVLVLFDSAGTPPEDQDFSEAFKTEGWNTEASVCKALEELGHEVSTLGIYDDIGLVMSKINENKPDIVFNLTEIFRGKAHLDKNIPAFLELLNIPYTGCGPAGLMICNNKVITKKILKYHRIKIPGFTIFRKGKKIRRPKRLNFPIIVKPVQEEASTGISQASFVDNEKDLEERVEFIHEKFNMDAMAEEYINGRELYMSVMGRERLQTFSIREMKFLQVSDDEPKLATYKAKWDNKYRKKWGIKNEFAGRLPEGIQEKIVSVCKRAYRALRIDGYGRFDLRLSPAGDIFILEANANPCLDKEDEFGESVQRAGTNYNNLIQNILAQGLSRGEM